MASDSSELNPHPADLRSYGRKRGRKPSPRQERLLKELLPKVAIDLANPPPPRGEGLEPAPDLIRGVGGLFTYQPSSNAPFLAPPPAPPHHGEGSAKQHHTPAPAAGSPEESRRRQENRARSGRLREAESEGATAPAAGSPEESRRRQETWLEIGFGGAEHLVWQAEQNPDVAFIGCEPFEDGVIKALAAIEDKKLANIRLHADDARPLLRWLPEASVGRAFILFPDPWPKRKHVKRRLVSPATLAMLARVMRPGAELRIATDIADYARTTLLAIAATPAFRWTATSPGDWRERPADWPGTRYEAKAIREGRRRYFFRFQRV